MLEMTDLNKNEQEVLRAVIWNVKDCTHWEFGFGDEIEVDGLSKHQVAGYLSSLQSKGYIFCHENPHGTESSQITLRDDITELGYELDDVDEVMKKLFVVIDDKEGWCSWSNWDPPLRDNRKNSLVWPDLVLPEEGHYGDVKVERCSEGHEFRLWQNGTIEADFEVTALQRKSDDWFDLMRGLFWKPWMSDTPQERYMMQNAANLVKGRVLVGGLGLGIFPQYALSKKATEIVVVEINPDIIDITKPLFDTPALEPIRDKVTIIQDNLFDYVGKTEEKFDTAYFDIWETIRGDNIAQMNWLRHHSRRSTSGRVLCWGHSWSIKMFLKECWGVWDTLSRHLDSWEEKKEGFQERFPLDFQVATWAVDQNLPPTRKELESKAKEVALTYMRRP
jgi:hypothetical protein